MRLPDLVVNQRAAAVFNRIGLTRISGERVACYEAGTSKRKNIVGNQTFQRYQLILCRYISWLNLLLSTELNSEKQAALSKKDLLLSKIVGSKWNVFRETLAKLRLAEKLARADKSRRIKTHP